MIWFEWVRFLAGALLLLCGLGIFLIEMIGVFVGKKQMFERRCIESELHLFRIGIGTVVDADAVIERIGGGHAEIFSSAFAGFRTEIAAAETRRNSLRRRAAHNGNCMLH